MGQWHVLILAVVHPSSTEPDSSCARIQRRTVPAEKQVSPLDRIAVHVYRCSVGARKTPACPRAPSAVDAILTLRPV